RSRTRGPATLPLMDLPFLSSETAATEIYTLSLHDALPIYLLGADRGTQGAEPGQVLFGGQRALDGRCMADIEPLPAQRTWPGSADRKSTRLNSSHVKISYAVFCLKKKTALDVKEREGESDT